MSKLILSTRQFASWPVIIGLLLVGAFADGALPEYFGPIVTRGACFLGGFLLAVRMRAPNPSGRRRDEQARG